VATSAAGLLPSRSRATSVRCRRRACLGELEPVGAPTRQGKRSSHFCPCPLPEPTVDDVARLLDDLRIMSTGVPDGELELTVVARPRPLQADVSAVPGERGVVSASGLGERSKVDCVPGARSPSCGSAADADGAESRDALLETATGTERHTLRWALRDADAGQAAPAAPRCAATARRNASTVTDSLAKSLVRHAESASQEQSGITTRKRARQLPRLPSGAGSEVTVAVRADAHPMPRDCATSATRT